MMRPRYRQAFATLAGWRFDAPLFARLMRFGLPSGLQFSLEAMAFGIFLVLIGQMGNAALSATSIAFTVNMVALIPMVGLAQASSVLVGQRLGQDRPDVAARTAARGVAWALVYTGVCALLFVAAPGPIVNSFRDPDANRWAVVSELVPVLLRFVALYCAFESVTMMVSAALRGAGDTRFVSLATLVAVWSVMVIPTVLSRRAGHGLLMPWGFATAYVILLSLILFARFRQGRWRSMRVIEPAPGDLDLVPEEVAA
jgi:MATE family multidrug resistance protein